MLGLAHQAAGGDGRGLKQYGASYDDLGDCLHRINDDFDDCRESKGWLKRPSEHSCGGGEQSRR